MATHVALLRGINVSGKNKVAMPDLRTLVAELGHADVTTYIQSGNVLFTPAGGGSAEALAAGIAAAITGKLGVTSPVIVLPREELAAIVAANPFPDEPDQKRVHAVVLSEPPWPELAVKLEAARAKSAAAGGEDQVAAIGRALYLRTPDGYGRSVLAETLLRAVSSPKSGATGTARNWATMTKLLALCDG